MTVLNNICTFSSTGSSSHELVKSTCIFGGLVGSRLKLVCQISSLDTSNPAPCIVIVKHVLYMQVSVQKERLKEVMRVRTELCDRGV